MNKEQRDQAIQDRIVICTRTAGGKSIPVCYHTWKKTLSAAYDMCAKCGIIRKAVQS